MPLTARVAASRPATIASATPAYAAVLSRSLPNSSFARTIHTSSSSSTTATEATPSAVPGRRRARSSQARPSTSTLAPAMITERTSRLATR